MKRNPKYRTNAQLPPDQLAARMRYERAERALQELADAAKCTDYYDPEALKARLCKRVDNMVRAQAVALEADPELRERMTTAAGVLGDR